MLIQYEAWPGGSCLGVNQRNHLRGFWSLEHVSTCRALRDSGFLDSSGVAHFVPQMCLVYRNFN